MQSEKSVSSQNWDVVIEPTTGLFDINFRELWQYRDLLSIFIKREIVSYYKQTILGPLWFFIQPLLTTIIYTLVFSRIAGIETWGIPPILFYLSGIVLWNYFADCLNATAGTFTANAAIFGKVYFPRLIVPLSKIISNLIKFLIQFFLLLIIYIWYCVRGDVSVPSNVAILALPIMLIIMAGLGLGAGMIVTSLTTKYRDLTFLLSFGVQLFMYASPVIYSLKTLEGSRFYDFIYYNPITSVIELFRYSLFGIGEHSVSLLIYTGIFMCVLLFLGILIFNKTEKLFTDTV